MAEVPDDLAHWFEHGTCLADRYNLPRISFRFRVIEVDAVLGDAEWPYIVKGEHREFRTHVAASRLAKRWAQEGKHVMQQTGILLWMTDDEMPGNEQPESPPALESSS